MYSTNEFHKGLFIEVENVPYQILEFQHVKPGKGNAFVRTRIKNLLTNNVIERTFKSGDTVQEPAIESKHVQYLYSDQNGFQIMDLDSYEQMTLTPEQMGDRKFYLVDNMEMDVLYYKGKPIAVEIPNFVNLRVKDTEPGIKGDTASGGGKPATLTTGLTVTVPFHIKIDDLLKVDTRTGTYVEKIKA